MGNKFKCCGYCGKEFQNNNWPRKCLNCQNISYRNPLPVVVCVVNTDHPFGIVVVKRGIEPQKGQWALPGGFVDYGETWQEAASRELLEETDIDVSPLNFRLHSVESTQNHVLIFTTTEVEFNSIKNTLKIPKDSNEVDDVRIMFGITKNNDLAFPQHTKVVKEILGFDSYE